METNAVDVRNAARDSWPTTRVAVALQSVVNDGGGCCAAARGGEPLSSRCAFGVCGRPVSVAGTAAQDKEDRITQADRCCLSNFKSKDLHVE